MESLNIFPDYLLPDDAPSSQTLELKDLENVLARMTAIEFWAGAIRVSTSLYLRKLRSIPQQRGKERISNSQTY